MTKFVNEIAYSLNQYHKNQGKALSKIFSYKIIKF